MTKLNHNCKILEMLQADDWWALFDWPEYETYQEEPVVAFARVLVYHSVASYPVSEEEWAEAERAGAVSIEVVPIVKDYSWDGLGTHLAPYYHHNTDDLGRMIGLYKGKGTDPLCGKKRRIGVREFSGVKRGK